MEPENEVNKINSDDLAPLKEGGLNRLLDKHCEIGFIIFTSYRGENDDDVNKALFKKLKQTLRENRYGFVPVWGSYIENKGEPNETLVKEPFMIIANYKVDSFKIHAEDKLNDLGILLCKTYNQDRFLYRSSVEIDKAYFIDKSGNITATFIEKTIDDLAKEYFISLFDAKNMAEKSFDPTDKRVTFTGQFYMHPSPGSVGGAIKRYGEHFYSRSYIEAV